MDKIEMYIKVDKQIKFGVRRFMDMIINEFGLSQKDIANHLGVSCPAVCNWYSGQKIPSLRHYYALMNLWTLLCDMHGEYYVK